MAVHEHRPRGIELGYPLRELPKRQQNGVREVPQGVLPGLATIDELRRALPDQQIPSFFDRDLPHRYRDPVTVQLWDVQSKHALLLPVNAAVKLASKEFIEVNTPSNV